MIVSAGPQVVEHPEAGPSPRREANAPTGMSVESTETPTNRPHATGGEMRLTLLLLLFSFFGLGLPRVFTSTAAHTLFIETYGPEMIPYAYVMEALLVPLFGHLYMAADERFSLRQLIAGSMAVDLIMLVALWLGFSVAEFRPVAFVAMVWFETEFVFCSLWLWGMAGQLMTIRQGKAAVRLHQRRRAHGRDSGRCAHAVRTALRWTEGLVSILGRRRRSWHRAGVLHHRPVHPAARGDR